MRRGGDALRVSAPRRSRCDVPDEKCMSEVFDFRTLRPATFRVGPFQVTADQVGHVHSVILF